MKKVLWILAILLPYLTVFGQPQDSIARYLELYDHYPKAFGAPGNWQEGEVETISDYEKISQAQSESFQNFCQKGFSEEEAAQRSRLGVVSEDGYWVWVREVLMFPSGQWDIYNRFIHKSSLKNVPGRPVMCSVILVQLPDEKLVVNLIFRNGTRSWEIELPRGGIDPGESSQDAAKREMLEETGYSVDTLSYLGAIPMDSSLCSQFFHVYFAKAVDLNATDREEGEVIASIMTLSKEEAKEALCRGQMELEVNGRKITAFCRDYHMAYAILLAEAKGLL